jgi:hypothetical protein
MHPTLFFLVFISNVIELPLLSDMFQVERCIFAQIFLEDYDNLSFRATPDYLGTGPWYDWVLVSFINSNEQSLHYPFKILGFVEKDDKSGPICFGQMCAMQSEKERLKSCMGLFEHWHLEQRPNSNVPIFRFVEINSIINSCLAFQLTNGALKEDQSSELSKQVIVVKDRQKEWPKLFLTGINDSQEKKKKRKR